jgi:hypothetical protein
MKTAMFLSFICGLVTVVPEATAGGRFIKGRTVYQRKCAPCFSIGWKWAPKRVSNWSKVSLKAQARRWSTVKVCTWMSKSAKTRKGALCHPSKMTYREKLNALYYVKRRAQGAITKPVLRKRTPKVYRGPKFRKRAGKRRAAALRQRKQLEALRKARRRYRGKSKFKWSRKRRSLRKDHKNPSRRTRR